MDLTCHARSSRSLFQDYFHLAPNHSQLPFQLHPRRGDPVSVPAARGYRLERNLRGDLTGSHGCQVGPRRHNITGVWIAWVTTEIAVSFCCGSAVDLGSSGTQIARIAFSLATH